MNPSLADRSELLLIAGRSGVGKSTAAFELHALLSALEVKHAVIEGDALDLAYPPPWAHGLAERNLEAIWQNYRALDYRRLIFTNTVSVAQIDALTTAMHDDPVVIPVLLRASDEEAVLRLARRESGSQLDEHVTRSAAAAARLDELDDSRIVRVNTDGMSARAVARRLLSLSGWASDHGREHTVTDGRS